MHNPLNEFELKLILKDAQDIQTLAKAANVLYGGDEMCANALLQRLERLSGVVVFSLEDTLEKMGSKPESEGK